MTNTIRIYENNSHAEIFNAIVLGCESVNEKNKEKSSQYYKIVLNSTAFFPEGGGQKGDCGYMASGKIEKENFFKAVIEDQKDEGAEVNGDTANEKNSVIPQKKKICENVAEIFDTQEKDGVIFHYSTKPFEVGETVTGLLNFEIRFRRMQNHTGEHIVSGIINKYFGFNNVGFHMGTDEVTLDVDGVLTKAEMDFVEAEANKAVVENVPVCANVYSGEELANLDYRSKLALTENVRIVTVVGYDKCACCAPHVETTGEIGIIKILGFINYKQGVRIRMLCGFDALDDYENKLQQAKTVSNLLSVKQGELASGVERLIEENKKEKQESNALKNTIATLLLEKAKAEKINCIFTDINDPVFMRYLATGGADAFGICGVFCDLSEGNYRYVCVGKDVDMRAFAKELNVTLNGRGGGDSELVQGSVKSDEESIRKYFSNLN